MIEREIFSCKQKAKKSRSLKNSFWIFWFLIVLSISDVLKQLSRQQVKQSLNLLLRAFGTLFLNFSSYRFIYSFLFGCNQGHATGDDIDTHRDLAG